MTPDQVTMLRGEIAQLRSDVAEALKAAGSTTNVYPVPFNVAADHLAHPAPKVAAAPVIYWDHFLPEKGDTSCLNPKLFEQCLSRDALGRLAKLIVSGEYAITKVEGK